MGLLDLIHFGAWVYGYCTDFVINMANLTNTSYYEVNAALFVFSWPLLTALLFIVVWFQEVKIYFLKSKKY